MQAAVDMDPAFAPAWAALSPSYGALAYWGHVRPIEVVPKSIAAARKAIELDETLADGHCWLGAATAYVYRDWAAAETEVKRAIELNPSSADAHETHGKVLVSLRRTTEAMEQFRIARGLDPFPPIRSALVALCFLVSGRYQEAADQHKREIEIAPDFFITRWAYWRVLHRQGRSAEALSECKRSYGILNDTEVLQALEQGEQQSGYAGAMKAAAQTLEKRARTKYVAGNEVARLCAFAGENARAVEWLETAHKDGDPRLHLLWAEPDWEPLYGNPRFQNLLRKLGFPSVEKSAAWSGQGR
ncbi:MAG: tetratricopeptide repeat protein [Acidobacteria bacterium]|nr:tetratricopeptide repeat protein [Acidobacteriota bacterium]